MKFFSQSIAVLALSLGLFACPAPQDQSTPPPGMLKCPTGYMADGVCYASSQEACNAIGCAADQCLAALSKPPVMSCKTPPKCDPKQTIAAGQCYDSSEAACTALGCAADQCITTRSLPPIASCKTPTPQ